MNQPNQGNDPNAPPSVPVKRKRGRPRKDKSLNRVVTVHVPPGFQGVNGNQPRQADPIDEGNDGMVGQAVTGVVEAAFDAGYLLTVKIGNSNTYLRGVVFKPGHYVPISAQNDVAPQVQMVRRNDIHLPTENPIRERGHSQRSRERNELYNISGNDTSLVLNGSHRGSRVRPRKSKTVSPVLAPSVPLVGSRGTVVPVILQPVALSNGQPQASHVGPPKDVQVQKVASQTLQSQPNQVSPKSGQNENSPFHQGSPEVKITGLPVQDSHSLDAPINNGAPASKLSAEDSDHTNVNEPLVIEPLQAIRSDVNQATSTPKVLESNRAGRMTELLQAVQETMADNKEQGIGNLHTDTRSESREPKSPETSLGDEETDHSNKRSRGSSD